MIRSPVVVMGDKALNPALAVVWPVPPLAMGSVPVTPVVKGNPVLLANDHVVVCNVPLVGKVKLVLPVAVNVWVNAPEWVTLPAMVIVFEPLLTPVPP